MPQRCDVAARALDLLSNFVQDNDRGRGVRRRCCARELGIVAARIVNANTRFTTHDCGRNEMSTIVIVILVLILIGALPTWPYSAGWGFYPSGGLGLILLIVVVLALTGRL
jgi:hypothetical protein